MNQSLRISVLLLTAALGANAQENRTPANPADIQTSTQPANRQPTKAETKSFLDTVVNTVYIQGKPSHIDLEAIAAYRSVGGDCLKELKPFLSPDDPADSKETLPMENAVRAIAHTGDPAAFEILTTFLEEKKNGTEHEHALYWRAKLAVPLALGFLAERTTDPDTSADIINYLEILARDPNAWLNAVNLNTDNLFNTHQQRWRRTSLEMSLNAIKGLGLSGHPKALEILQDMRDKNPSDFSYLFDDAIENHKKMQALGLENLDRERREKYREYEIKVTKCIEREETGCGPLP